MTAVATTDTSHVTLPGLPGELTLTYYRPPESLAFDDWQEVGRTLRAINQSVQWWIGDWLRFGERKYGEKYTQAIDATGYDYQTLANMAYVAARVEISRRRENVSWSHHAEVASLPPEKQNEVLNAAESNQLNREQVRARVAIEKGRPDTHRLYFDLPAKAIAALKLICERLQCDDEEAVTRALVYAARALEDGNDI